MTQTIVCDLEKDRDPNDPDLCNGAIVRIVAYAGDPTSPADLKANPSFLCAQHLVAQGVASVARRMWVNLNLTQEAKLRFRIDDESLLIESIERPSRVCIALHREHFALLHAILSPQLALRSK